MRSTKGACRVRRGPGISGMLTFKSLGRGEDIRGDRSSQKGGGWEENQESGDIETEGEVF